MSSFECATDVSKRLSQWNSKVVETRGLSRSFASSTFPRFKSQILSAGDQTNEAAQEEVFNTDSYISSISPYWRWTISFNPRPTGPLDFPPPAGERFLNASMISAPMRGREKLKKSFESSAKIISKFLRSFLALVKIEVTRDKKCQISQKSAYSPT